MVTVTGFPEIWLASLVFLEGIDMRYGQFTEEVKRLGFIRDAATANAAVKAVLGILASRLYPQDRAKTLADGLPAQLSYDKLVGRQKRPTPAKAADYVHAIAARFKLGDDQARILIDTVLHVAKQNFDRDTVEELEAGLPSDWVQVVEKA